MFMPKAVVSGFCEFKMKYEFIFGIWEAEQSWFPVILIMFVGHKNSAYRQLICMSLID